MRYHHELSNRCSRSGYTLLELMLALGLLGALLTVAWSLMGTYRAAEQKGWQLSMRTQTVRAIHSWLMQDIEHVSHVAASLRDSENPRPSLGASLGETDLRASLGETDLRASLGETDLRASNHGFRGTATGFSVTIQPSLAPLPFLERLMSAPDGEPLNVTDSLMLSTTQDSPAPPSLWSNEPTRIEYRLVPTTYSDTASLATAASSSKSGSASETGYRLSRVARRTSQRTDAAQKSSSGTQTSAADRVLTAQDLYRQTEDEPSEMLGPVLEESVLSGLVNARFRYFDGRSWLDEWNTTSSSLPLAVALSFDMPQRFEPTLTPVPQTAGDSFNDERDPLSGGYLDAELTMADTALASEPIAEIDVGEELSLVENDSHQVHIVVRTPAATDRTSPPPAGWFQGGVP